MDDSNEGYFVDKGMYIQGMSHWIVHTNVHIGSSPVYVI